VKLGILVVYLVNEDDEPLLDLHLNQIEETTRVPYTIYGSVNRLMPKFRWKLEQHPEVKICECPDTDLRGIYEHSYYLEYLTRAAIQDGVTHVVTLHVDSFPVRLGWAEKLAQKVSDICVFATIDPLNTACLFFPRDFYIRYQPTFLLSREDVSSPQCRQYRKKYHVSRHSGIGYGFKAYTEGLSWYSLRESAKDSADLCSIYGGLIFHVCGAVRVKEASSLLQSYSHRYIAAIRGLRKAISTLPSPLEKKLLRRLMKYQSGKPYRVYIAQELEYEKRRLFEDPQSYLRQLQESNT